MVKLVYGLKDGKLLHINEVKQGLECECLCPNCKARLIARKGKIKEHHFAHETKECDITIAQETALHFMAKEILSESKTINLPKVVLRDEFAFMDEIEYYKLGLWRSSIITKSNLYFTYNKYSNNIRKITSIELEKYMENIKPDIIMNIENKQLLIEIAVTHFIDDVKKAKIYDKHIPTLEIDLSTFKEKINAVDKNELKKILIKESNYKNWIYYENIQNDYEEAKNKNLLIIEKLKEINQYWLNNFTDDYRKCYNSCCRNDTNDYIDEFWNKQWLSKIMPMPWFANYPVNGDILYKGDRRRWQSIVISKIYYSKHGMSEEEIVKFITEQGFLKVYDNDYNMSFEDRQKHLLKKTNRYQVVRDYYKFLKEQNIIDKNGKWIYTEKYAINHPSKTQ